MTLKKVHVGMVCRNIKTQHPYEVIAIARHSETEEWMIIYQSKQGGDKWARPLLLFLEKFEEGDRNG